MKPHPKSEGKDMLLEFVVEAKSIKVQKEKPKRKTFKVYL